MISFALNSVLLRVACYTDFVFVTLKGALQGEPVHRSLCKHVARSHVNVLATGLNCE